MPSVLCKLVFTGEKSLSCPSLSIADERASPDSPLKVLFVVAVPLCEQSLSESRPSIRAGQRTPVINRYNGKGGGGGVVAKEERKK